METESGSIKLRRYDLSMSKRTRKSNMARVTSQENEDEVKELNFTPVILSQHDKEEPKEFKITPVFLSQQSEGDPKEFETKPVFLSQPNEEEPNEFKTTPVFLSQQNEEPKEAKTSPVILSQQSEEDSEVKCVIKEELVNEKVFISVPPTPSRPSLKELIQVTNKEEKAAKESTKDDLTKADTREKVFEKEKEKFLPVVVTKKGQIVNGGKSGGMMRRCAKALNKIIKARHGQKPKNIVPLLAL